jgi:hypothetical protein
MGEVIAGFHRVMLAQQRFETQSGCRQSLPVQTAVAGILEREKDGQCVLYGLKDRLAVKMCELVRTQIAE